ncbi:MAG: extracellular catalytic domain type 2 short-chain-length polyhydroxyalkanoate depolymerase [Zoogloea sp.]|uniref:extracellular catalytic domain type 2 short-chain-length polyhydroxyalkanoate depolymerase n=1 Tax=Zoogloea sp. TaxID=49181 RepID=UPI003F2AE9EC
MRCAMVLGMLGVAAAQAAPLPALKAGQDISVSGVSSGGYMAVQMQVAHAQQVSGAGIFAAGPYDCAQGSMLRALTHCMAGSRWFPPPIPADARALIENRARAGSIDSPAALARQRVWVLGGHNDQVVERPVVQALLAFYRDWIPAPQIAFVSLPEAGHGMISVADPAALACGSNKVSPHINRCGDFDGAGALLAFLLGPLQPRQGARPEHLHAFDQTPYGARDAGMADTGYAYIPAACTQGGCRVHVAFHGCEQSAEQIGRRFVEGSGYNEWAEANRLIVLYPQIAPRLVSNPKGCWDWWGYTDAAYATRNGAQIRAVWGVVAQLGR